MVTMVDPRHVRPIHKRGEPIYGYCYLKAGFTHVGFTKAGQWVWQLLPDAMPSGELANCRMPLFEAVSVHAAVTEDAAEMERAA